MFMRRMGYGMMVAGVIGASLVGYCLMNRDTKKSADKLLNTVMGEADKTIRKIA